MLKKMHALLLGQMNERKAVSLPFPIPLKQIKFLCYNIGLYYKQSAVVNKSASCTIMAFLTSYIIMKFREHILRQSLGLQI